MKVQLVSDIHLEHLEDEEDLDFELILSPCASVLVMAGDVATNDCPLLPVFLSWVGSKFEHVIWVLGNHEFYNTKRVCMDQIKNKLRGMCPKNVRILDNEFVIVDGVMFIGSTLWSHVPKEYRDKVETMVSDYRYIFSDSCSGIVTCEYTNKLYEECLAYIRHALEQDRCLKRVVITHHAPSMEDTLHPKYAGSPLNYAFASNIVFSNGKGPNVWCYGHTHYNQSIDNHTHGYKLVSNQFGYEGEHTGRIYKWDYVFDV